MLHRFSLRVEALRQQFGATLSVLTKRSQKVLEQSASAVQSDVDGLLKNMDTQVISRLLTKPRNTLRLVFELLGGTRLAASM